MKMVDACLCIRVEDMLGTPAEGSIQGTCAGCQALVWLGPVAQIIVEEEKVPLICVNCLTLLNSSDKSSLN